jgi:excisionase family DNA binding protein
MTTRPDPPRYLRSGQVAKLLGVSREAVARYARKGKLPSVRTLGGHRRYPETEIRELVATNTFRPDEEAF